MTRYGWNSSNRSTTLILHPYPLLWLSQLMLLLTTTTTTSRFPVAAATTVTTRRTTTAFQQPKQPKPTFFRSKTQHRSIPRRSTQFLSIMMSSSSSSDRAATATTPTVLDPYNLPPVSQTTPTKRIFWIRHGEVINPGAAQNRSVYYGALDVPLSDHGKAEAMAAANYIATTQHTTTIDQVYSSPLSRAIYGAKQICQILNNQQPQPQQQLTVQQLDGFRELDRGDWAGLTLDEIGREVMEQFDACDESVTPGGSGESYPTLMARVLHARDTIVLPSLSYGQTAVVVSHLQVTRCVLSQALQIPIHKMSKLKIATASITCIDYEYTDKSLDGASGNNDDDDDDDCIPTPSSMTVQFQSFKPNVGLRMSQDGAN